MNSISTGEATFSRNLVLGFISVGFLRSSFSQDFKKHEVRQVIFKKDWGEVVISWGFYNFSLFGFSFLIVFKMFSEINRILFIYFKSILLGKSRRKNKLTMWASAGRITKITFFWSSQIDFLSYSYIVFSFLRT